MTPHTAPPTARRATPARRLSARTYRTLTTIHIGSSVGLLGSSAGLLILALSATHATPPGSGTYHNIQLLVLTFASR